MNVGEIVRSKDTRDDPEMFYVVLETDVRMNNPDRLVTKIAECGREERGMYRTPRLLVSAEDDVQRLVLEANRLARTRG